MRCVFVPVFARTPESKLGLVLDSLKVVLLSRAYAALSRARPVSIRLRCYVVGVCARGNVDTNAPTLLSLRVAVALHLESSLFVLVWSTIVKTVGSWSASRSPPLPPPAPPRRPIGPWPRSRRAQDLSLSRVPSKEGQVIGFFFTQRCMFSFSTSLHCII